MAESAGTEQKWFNAYSELESPLRDVQKMARIAVKLADGSPSGGEVALLIVSKLAPMAESLRSTYYQQWHEITGKPPE